MKWFRYARGLVFGVTMVVYATVQGGFDTVGLTLFTIAFLVIGSGLTVLMVWAGWRDFRRARAQAILEATPVLESPDAGMGFFRREWAERERAERERAERERAESAPAVD